MNKTLRSGSCGLPAAAAAGRRVPRAVVAYVRWVEAVGRFFGRIAMYLVFVMIGVLLYSAFMRTGFNRPPLWSVEMSQFLLAAYYILGGAWTLQLDSHVRMDLLYARWTPAEARLRRHHHLGLPGHLPGGDALGRRLLDAVRARVRPAGRDRAGGRRWRRSRSS